MAYANTYKRREMKFLLDEKQFGTVYSAIGEFMTEDEFGFHTIRNIYLDNENDDLIRSSLGKPIFKEKVRLRAYGSSIVDDSDAFIEIKKKYRGITYKRRYEGEYKVLHDYLSKGILPEKRDQVFEEINYLVKQKMLYPKIVICYDREAFFGKEDGEFRVTFDGNIRWRTFNIDLRAGDNGTPLYNAPYRVMEVKSAGAVPLWLVKILSQNKIYNGSFSKYGTIYQDEIKQNQLKEEKVIS